MAAMGKRRLLRVGGAWFNLRHILREAMHSGDTPFGSYDKADAANVASGFLDVLEVLIAVGARHLNPAWLKQKIEQSQQAHIEWCERQEERKAEFVERMRQARAKKREAKEVDA
jgi:hypothetical protein